MSSPGERLRCAACAHSKRKCSPECVYAPHFPPDDPDRYAAVHKAFLVRNIGQLLRELPPDQRAATADSLVCGVCKRVHGKCTPDCVLAPFFPPDDDSEARFAAVHDVFGYKNAAAVLGGLPPAVRGAAADALVYSALARRRDSVHGCVGEISALTARIKQVYEVLGTTKAKLAGYEEEAGAHAGTSSVETPQYDAMVPEMAMHLGAFVEVATEPTADDVRAEPGSSSGVTVAVSVPRPPVHEKQPPLQEQPATATVGDPSPLPFARTAAPRQLVDAQQLAAALEAARQRTMVARQAAR
ncbi:hypothetical protein EJB05_14971, partial [Eragrostis curvula]